MPEFQPLKIENFNLTETELAEIVEGAQTFLPPAEDDLIPEPVSD